MSMTAPFSSSPSKYLPLPVITLILSGLIILHCVPACISVVLKRTRLEIPEIEEAELPGLIKEEPIVAVLYHDHSKISMKTLRDLELIKSDSDSFGIVWRRMQTVAPLELLEEEEEASATVTVEEDTAGDQRSGEDTLKKKIIPASTVVLYKRVSTSLLPNIKSDSVAMKYPGRPDRQTAVLRWLITEKFCHKDSPLEVVYEQLEILIRTFRNFVLVANSLGHRKSRRLIHQFSKQSDLCHKVDNTLIVSTRDEPIFETLSIDLNRLPVILNIVHGIAIEYKESKQKLEPILEWIRVAAPGKVKHISEQHLDTILSREDLVLVLFLDPRKPARAQRSHSLEAQLKVSLADLETIFGLALVTVSDLKVAANYKVDRFPQAVLYDSGELRKFEGSFLSEDVAIEIKNWVTQTIEIRERTVIKAIESEEFKSHPNEFKNVLLKQHKDSIRMLSMEYARLQRQNQGLKAIIQAARDSLDSPLLESSPSGNEDGNNDDSSDLSAECGECLAAVGQAVWNCGTLEMECIKNAIELKSDCFGCVCEIFDMWWPNDAPNCFKKEIQKVISAPESKSRSDASAPDSSASASGYAHSSKAGVGTGTDRQVKQPDRSGDATMKRVPDMRGTGEAGEQPVDVDRGVAAKQEL